MCSLTYISSATSTEAVCLPPVCKVTQCLFYQDNQEIVVTLFCSRFRLKRPPATPSSLPLLPETVCFNQPTGKNVHPDLTNGKGTGTSPALGINREGLFFLARAFWGTLALLQK